MMKFWNVLRLCMAGCAGLLAAPCGAQEGAGDVVYVPTPQVVVDRMLSIAKVGASDFIIDLGSGDGRIVLTAAKQLGARGFGVDLDDVLLERSNNTVKAEGLGERARFIKENLFETDLSRATVITSYLLPEMNEKLRPKILALKPGTRVVAHDYHMGEWRADESDTLIVPEKKVGNPGTSYIYLWYVPANAAGRWQVKLPAQALVVDLEIDQRFQEFTGTAKVNDKPARMQGGRVRGDDLTFSVTTGSGSSAIRHEFNGKIKADAISGTLKTHAGKDIKQSAFTAQRTAAGQIKISGNSFAPQFAVR